MVFDMQDVEQEAYHEGHRVHRPRVFQLASVDQARPRSYSASKFYNSEAHCREIL